MKRLIPLVLLVLQFGLANGRANEKTTGIFQIYVSISEELTTEFKAKNNNRTVLNGYSESAIFPDNLLDSVRTITEVLLSEKLDSKAECTYKTNKKGKNVTTVGANNELEGMPINTFKNALTQSEFDQYVKVSVQYEGNGVSVDLGA